ncbi:hypothetical protein [Roseibium sediminis]|uniref:hypothetical protein n=1 Tax=Roseibium sediminis TaxID=1775174 RepID=UPI00123D0D3A|nr:hypothetical protein [Roseibium sediminis]
MQKTLKRETAIVLLVFLLGLCAYDVGQNGETPALAWANLLIWPVFTFAAGAFGLDALAKQIRGRGD